MKQKRTVYHSMIFLKMIVAILFVVLLFAPRTINRSLLAVIAITGIIGAFLLLVIPILPRIRKPQLNRQNKLKKRPSSEPLSGSEALLWKQISYQITDKLKSAFPKATWEFVRQPKINDLLNGNTIRIRTRNTGNYNFAEFHLNQYGYLALELLTIESLKRQAVPEPKDDTPQIDPKSWYTLVGKPVLVNLIGDLQARGYQKLFINETGEIFIRNENTPEIKGTFEDFPPKSYWPALADIFIEDELEAKELEHELELSWNA